MGRSPGSGDRWRSVAFVHLEPLAFARCRSTSIDYAIMERTETAVVFPAAFSWSDIGAFGSEIQTPMAIVILCGLTTSTLLNMFVVPTLYLRYGGPQPSA